MGRKSAFVNLLSIEMAKQNIRRAGIKTLNKTWKRLFFLYSTYREVR
ncbi:MAG: hypothetical protein OCU18_09070 [Candidatus Syntrophoarchaeum sp.]|nr:hypothetical protein [Candidatus Syntrophoarchaeum sp.]